jgi:hypothetical protein
MEHAEISPRPVVGAIVVVSGLAVSFLLWLLYVHHASADFAGRWMFLPALNAVLNGLCAIALCVGARGSNPFLSAKGPSHGDSDNESRCEGLLRLSTRAEPLR